MGRGHRAAAVKGFLLLPLLLLTTLGDCRLVLSPSTRAKDHGVSDCPRKKGAWSPSCISSCASQSRCGWAAWCSFCSKHRAGMEPTASSWFSGRPYSCSIPHASLPRARPYLTVEKLSHSSHCCSTFTQDQGLMTQVFMLFLTFLFLFSLFLLPNHFSTPVSFLAGTCKSLHLSFKFIFHRFEPGVIAAVQFFLARTGN